jgi:hypothetical protein
MKSRWLMVCWFVALIASGPVFAQNGNISLTTPLEQVSAGDTFAVTIQIRDVAGVYGGLVELAYDPQTLEVIQVDNQAVTPGDFFAGQPGFPLKNGADPASGVIEYALTLRQPALPVTGSGSLGTVQFRALRDGAAQINIAQASLLSPRFEEINGRTIARSVDEIPVNVQGLAIHVGGSGMQTVVQPPAEAPQQPQVVQAVPQTVRANPSALVQPTPGPSTAVMMGVIFFIIGLLLFTFSVGAYVRLRRQYAWHEGL